MIRPKHIPALDGLRGIAVLIVFLFHYGGGTHSSFRPMRWFGLINKGGWAGVTLFFVLSGFLITGILWDSFDDPHWWRKFFARRSLRIFPLYFLTLLLVLLAAIPGGTTKAVLAHLWVPALFLENVPHLGELSESLASPLPIFHLWSIAVEEQFYLIWPFLLVIQRSRQWARVLCLGTFAAAWLFRVVIFFTLPNPGIWDHFLFTHAGALALGGWLALSYRGPEWPRIVRIAPYVAAGGMLGFLITGRLAHSLTSGALMMVAGLPCITICFAAVLALAVQPGLVSRVFSWGALRWLGGISYGVYVFHMLLLPVIEWIAGKLAGGRSEMAFLATQFVVAAALTLVAALLSYHLFEKQFLRFKRFFIPKKADRISETA